MLEVTRSPRAFCRATTTVCRTTSEDGRAVHRPRFRSPTIDFSAEWEFTPLAQGGRQGFRGIVARRGQGAMGDAQIMVPFAMTDSYTVRASRRSNCLR